MKRLKAFTVRLIGGANIATICFMALCGFSDRFNPIDHPVLSCSGLLFPVFLFINFLFLIFWLLVYWRGAWIPVAGYLVCYIPLRTYMPINFSDEPPADAIKVASYNVASYGYGDLGLPNGTPSDVISWLIECDADIICIQEGLLSMQDSRMDDVLKKKYKYTQQDKRGGGTALSILSRFPIQKVESIDYGSVGNGSVAYELDYHGKPLVVVNNHLESNKFSAEIKNNFKQMVKGDLTTDEAKGESRQLFGKLREATMKRAPQAELVAQYIADRRKEGKSVIVCGDFNDSPISYVHRTMAADLTDCYVATGTGPGWSYVRGGMRVRIDNILCSDEWEPYGAKVDDSVGISDHYPIYCWLKMK